MADQSVHSSAGGEEPELLHERFLREFTTNRDRIFAYIHSLLPHRDDAEDVFQRVSVILWRKFDQFEPDGSFASWGCGVAFYEVKNFLRVSGRDRLRFSEPLLDQLSAERQASLDQHEPRLSALEQCLEKLDGTERELIRKVYQGGQSIKSLAETSGRAAQTFYNRLNLIRRKLLECVDRTAGREEKA